MIERVARALEAKITGKEFVSFEDAARAAIEAMREPTDMMKVAGGLKAEAIMFEADPDGTGVIFNDMGHIFAAMIDAALKEGS